MINIWSQRSHGESLPRPLTAEFARAQVDPQRHTACVFLALSRREGRISSLLSRRHRVWFCGSLLSHTWTRRALVGAIRRSPPPTVYLLLALSLRHVSPLPKRSQHRATAPRTTMGAIPANLLKTTPDKSLLLADDLRKRSHPTCLIRSLDNFS